MQGKDNDNGNHGVNDNGNHKNHSNRNVSKTRGGGFVYILRGRRCDELKCCNVYPRRL